MIRLFNNDTEEVIGEITDVQLDFLQEQLIEETMDAYTYMLTPATLSNLEMNGADPELLSMLRKALGPRTSIEIRYDLD